MAIFDNVTKLQHIISIHTSGDDGATWTRFDRRMEVSGYHHNVRGGFLMLRPGLSAAGPVVARFRDFRFTALDTYRATAVGQEIAQNERIDTCWVARLSLAPVPKIQSGVIEP